MKAKKDNKVYQINSEAEKEHYLKMGFDIYGDDGKIVQHSPTKKIAYSEYVQLQEENKALKEENAKLKKEAKMVE